MSWAETALLQKMRQRSNNERPIRLRKPPRQRYPHNTERWYKGRLLERVRWLNERLVDRVVPIYQAAMESSRSTYPVGASIRSDATIDWADLMVEEIGAIEAAYGVEYTRADDQVLADRVGTEVTEQNAEETARVFSAVLGVNPIASEPWLDGELERFRVANVQLIKSLPKQYLDQVEVMVTNAFAAGTPVRRFTKDLRKRFNISENRARLIARDQVGKLSGQLTMLRQTEAGITHYIWRTMRDERVRKSHAEKEGKTFAWSNPPSGTGHPGEDYQCRCHAEPDINRLLQDLEEESDTDAPTQLPEPPRIDTMQHNATKRTSVDLKPTAEMAREALLGLRLRGEFGRGGTAVGVARARDISNRKNLSPDTVRRMMSFFARHGAQKVANGWKNRNNPSAQWVAWLLWGGDSGKVWADRKWKELTNGNN